MYMNQRSTKAAEILSLDLKDLVGAHPRRRHIQTLIKRFDLGFKTGNILIHAAYSHNKTSGFCYDPDSLCIRSAHVTPRPHRNT